MGSVSEFLSFIPLGLIHQEGGLAQEDAHLLGEELHRDVFHLHPGIEGADLL